MQTQGRPVRRLSRRARIAMLLFVLPILIFSASTRSTDESESPEPASTVLDEERLPEDAGGLDGLKPVAQERLK